MARQHRPTVRRERTAHRIIHSDFLYDSLWASLHLCSFLFVSVSLSMSGYVLSLYVFACLCHFLSY